jgi:pimeloyl-ACP methyl ester carboxylesterase
VEREIEDLAAVIESAGGTAMVYGMSSGGVLALRAALAGVPVTRLALYEPPFDAPPGPPDYSARLASASPAEALELFMTGVMGMPAAVVADMRRSPMWPALEAVAPTLRYDDHVMADGTIPDVITLTTPTTVLAGTASPTWLRRTAKTLAEALPNGTTTELEDQTHDVNPTTLAKALTTSFT